MAIRQNAGEQSERMMRAAESGHAARARAQEGLTGQRTRGTSEALQHGESVGRTVIAGREDMRRQDEHEKLYGTEDKPGLKQQELAMRQQELTKTFDLREKELALQAADKGLQPTGQGQGPLPPDQQQNLQAQGEKGLELGGARGAMQPGYEANAERQDKNALKAYEANTDRMRANAYQEQQRIALQRSRMAGDKAAEEVARGNLMSPMLSDVAMLNRMMGSSGGTESDWSNLRSMVKDLPDSQAELKADAEKGFMTPRVRDFISAKSAASALNFTEGTGEFPPGDKVDMSHPKMRQLQAGVTFVKDMNKQMDDIGKQLGMGPSAWSSGFLKIRSVEEKNRYQNASAARLVKGGFMDMHEALKKSMMQMQQSGGLANNQIPSAGEQPPPAAAQNQRFPGSPPPETTQPDLHYMRGLGGQ